MPLGCDEGSRSCTWFAFATTWPFVMMYPSALMITPDPETRWRVTVFGCSDPRSTRNRTRRSGQCCGLIRRASVSSVLLSSLSGSVFLAPWACAKAMKRSAKWRRVSHLKCTGGVLLRGSRGAAPTCRNVHPPIERDKNLLGVQMLSHRDYVLQNIADPMLLHDCDERVSAAGQG